MKARLPSLLSMPPKLLPVLRDFNKYKYFYLEGGRGSAKTHTVARIILYLASKYRLRIVCGREVQNSIEESVYTVLTDLIDQYQLNFEVKATKLIHKETKSTFIFKGFREQGRVSIKGLEGVDILWIDEAQAVTKNTLEVLIPTIRKDTSRIFFTMNRYLDDDAVHLDMTGRPECLHIHIDYFENPFCPLTIKSEAETLKQRSQREYNHVYLGQPLNGASDYLFNYDKLSAAYNIEPFGVTSFPCRVIGIDFAAQGDDQCVASILDRVSNQHWQLTEQIAWDENDAMISVGRIVSILSEHHPTVSILDVGGMGHVVHNRLTELGVNIQRFDGATTELVDTKHYANARANGYYMLKDWFDKGHLVLDQAHGDVVNELKKIKMQWRSSGKRILEPKEKMKKELGYSPDRADSLMMAVWAAEHYIGNANSDAHMKKAEVGIVRKTTSSRQRRSRR